MRWCSGTSFGMLLREHLVPYPREGPYWPHRSTQTCTWYVNLHWPVKGGCWKGIRIGGFPFCQTHHLPRPDPPSSLLHYHHSIHPLPCSASLLAPAQPYLRWWVFGVLCHDDPVAPCIQRWPGNTPWWSCIVDSCRRLCIGSTFSHST